MKPASALWTNALLATRDSSPWSFSSGNEDACHGAAGVFLEPSQYGEKHF